MRLTLDTKNDLTLVSHVFAALRPKDANFSLSEIISFLDANPEVAMLNAAENR
jgi:spore coat polysaccharide biosynthesis protein SpsF (cytidylyltransferase family)